MLIDGDIPSLRISLQVILPTVLMVALFFLFVIRAAWRSQRGRPVTGAEGLVGQIGVARSDLALQGMAQVRGELWQAESDEPVSAGETVEVVEVIGLKLRVKKIKKNKGEDQAQPVRLYPEG